MKNSIKIFSLLVGILLACNNVHAAQISKKQQRLNKKLLDGVYLGNLEQVSLALEQGADPNVQNKNCIPSSALAYAAWAGYLEIAQALLHKEADINKVDKNNWTALMYAVNPFDSAKLPLVELFLKIPTIDTSIKNKNDETALDLACHKRAFHRYSSSNPQKENNAKTILTALAKHRKRTCIHAIKQATHGRIYADIANIIHEYSAHLPIPTEADQDLLYAVNVNKFTIAKNALKLGADINVRNENGNTPLMLAAMNWRHYDLIYQLQIHGADPTLTNNDDKTALDIAKAQQPKRADIIYLLEDGIETFREYNKIKTIT